MIRFGNIQVNEQSIKDCTREEFDTRFKEMVQIPLDDCWKLFCDALGREVNEAPKPSFFDVVKKSKKKNKKGPSKDREGL